MRIPPRAARVAALLTAALVGSAVIAQQAAPTATAPTPAATATRHLYPTRGSCPKGMTLVSSSTAAGAPASCEPINQPETFADLQAMTSSYLDRTTGSGGAQPGAYQAAMAERGGLAPAGALPGSGAAWGPYGHAPECAGTSTAPGGPCPGPGPENGNYSSVGALGFRTLSGRITAIADDPSTPGTFFASPTAGGVFESTDGGNTWHSIGDGLPDQVVGGLAYDVPLKRLLVGSGDNSTGGSGIEGHGLYFSDDGGASWHTAAGYPDIAVSFRVLVSPADPTGDTVYAASSKGLFRSTDGGASFVNENLPTTPAGYVPNCAGDTTTPHCFFANVVSDVVVKSTGSTNAPAGAVMAVVGWRAGQHPFLKNDGTNDTSCTLSGTPTPCLQAPQGGLYISTTGAPNSFTYQPQGSGPTTAQGFAPDQVVGRTALGIANGAGQDNDAVYALVEDAVKFNGCPDVLDTGTPPTCNATVSGLGFATYLDGMYATYDFGKSWTKIMDYTQTKYPNTGSSLLGQTGYSPGIQAWYNLWVAPDPSVSDSNHDPVRVAFGLEEIWENNQVYTTALTPNPELHNSYLTQPPGGAVADPWVVIGRYWNACAAVNSPVNCNQNANNNPIPGTTTHPDQHAALFVPDGSGGVTLFAGSDGGMYQQHVAAGADFSNDRWGDGSNLGIYSQQPYDAEIAKDGTVVAGLQDNGEDKITSAGLQSEIYGGDAFYNTIDPNNSSNIIEEYTYGAASLTEDGGNSWFSITPSNCGASTSNLFSTPIEQDPTTPGHLVMGCTQVQEATNAYANPCTAPAGAPPATCVTNGTPFTTVFDLSTAPNSPVAPIPSAVGVQGANIYVGYCGYCDALNHGPFHSGIATNVGGSVPPAIGTGNGWHFAAGNCSNCGTPDGKLPQRYINSIQMDPNNPSTVYVTMGGYGRPWIPPGAMGDSAGEVGTGHVFVSYDHGQNFTDISGTLPNTPAFWTLLHNGNLVVATDMGVFESQGASGGSYGVLGTGLPNVPVFTLRLAPGNANLMIAATYGRGVYEYTFTDTPPGLPSQFVSLPPSRLLDTRLPTQGSCSATGTGTAEPCATLGGAQSMDVQITGAHDVTTGLPGGVPADGTVTAVALNVTVTDTTASSYLTVWPKGAARPTASNLNFVAGQVVPNFVQVPVSSDGKVSVFNLAGRADVVFDVAGYYTTSLSGSAGLFRPVAPARLMDTRLGSPGCTTTSGTCTTLGPGGSLTLHVGGAANINTGQPSGVPGDGTAASVVLNLTVTNPTGSGYLTAYPAGTARPFASNVNFVPGLTVPNRAIVKLGTGGEITLFNNAGSTDVVVDVGGFYTSATATGSNGLYTPVSPGRILDTRTAAGGCASACATIPANSSLTLHVAGSTIIGTSNPSNVPPMTAPVPPTAVALNVTAVQPSRSSFLTIFPSGAVPVISDLNMTPGVTVPNLVVVKLAPDGSVTIYNQQGNVDVVVDVEGWYS